MRLSFLAAALVAVGFALGSCSGGGLRSSFPREEEVRGKLEKGMTAEQVLATFGNPPGLQQVDVKLGGKVHYIAPSATRTRKEMGYAGFTVYFDRGKVWDWEVIQLNPSYEHRLLANGARSWQAQVVLSAGAVVLAFFAIRYSRTYSSRRKELLQAYAARAMRTAELPPDFRFLTHETTVQAVLDEAGTPSRKSRLPLKQQPGETPIEVLEYELPNDAALFVIPEQPAAPESRIRAVVYRTSR
jgi:hypothetical protein